MFLQVLFCLFRLQLTHILSTTLSIWIIAIIFSVLQTPWWAFPGPYIRMLNFYFSPIQIYQLKETWRYHWHSKVISFLEFSSIVTAKAHFLFHLFFLSYSSLLCLSSQKSFPHALLSPENFLHFHLTVFWGGGCSSSWRCNLRCLLWNCPWYIALPTSSFILA